VVSTDDRLILFGEYCNCYIAVENVEFQCINASMKFNSRHKRFLVTLERAFEVSQDVGCQLEVSSIDRRAVNLDSTG
jgi:hypothetical protein